VGAGSHRRAVGTAAVGTAPVGAARAAHHVTAPPGARPEGQPQGEPGPTAPGRPPAEKFRGDVAGLRAVAVGLVLLFHAGLPYLPGGFVGVDVFFVISGFLITGQLVKEIERTGRVSLTGFYARRAKRILPAAAVVLIATAVAARFVLPRARWEEVGGDLVAAATYIVNWRFAERSIDYLASDDPPSPVQHFWSLAVEEQFYLVWPLLIIAVLLVARLLRTRSVRPILWLGLALVAVPSFAWSIVQSAASPDRAFFVSTTRMWELAVGAGVALLGLGVARIPRGVAIVLGWSGLAAIGASAVLITEGTRWPGYAAALPTLGSAAIIAAGLSAGPAGPVALLGTRPFRWVGDLSYSLYLWHWPMLVLATAHWGGLSLARGLAVAAASAIPAWITYRLVENPLRYSRAVSGSPRLALSLGGNFTLVGICAGLALLVMSPTVPGSDPGQGGGGGPAAAVPGGFAPGAAVLAASPGAERPPVPERFDFITPDPLRAPWDLPVSTRACFQQIPEPELIWCTYGNPNGKTTVALVGDSKMDQWLPAFQVLAAQYDWRLDVAFKGACPFMSAPALRGRGEEPYTSCTAWNRSLLDRLVKERPDYVVTSHGSWLAADANGEPSVDAMAAGMRRSWQELDEVGTKVILMANNGGPTRDMMACVDENREKLSVCTFDRARLAADDAYRTQRKAVEGVAEVKMIDMFDVICPTVRCPAVIGNVLIYRKGSHITATYVATTAPQLARKLAAAGMPLTLR
jgi:peptidoglycan/LPS O-acetylase OafA/YrhL